MAVSQEVREKREAIVREHVASENRADYEATLETFAHPRYEFPGSGEVFEGPDAVARYYEEMKVGFPDRLDVLLEVHHADDAVVIEFDARGTHLGPYRGLPPTGRAFQCRMSAVMVFEDERLVCERVYFDTPTILRQLGVARDPTTAWGRLTTIFNHPLTVGQALVRRLRRR